MLHEDSLRGAFSEEAGYFELPQSDIYTVNDRVTNPAARVLLIGLVASERHFADMGALAARSCGEGC